MRIPVSKIVMLNLFQHLFTKIQKDYQKREAEMNVRRMIVALFVVVICLGFSQNLLAQEMKFELNKGYGMKEILASYEGKRVAIRLDGGEELEGVVTTVGDQLVHVAKLSKRDFYDAVIRIEKINAIIFRARNN
jgi:small nuclear ribonucleoprotein (snRNP)-like protein